MSVDPSGFIDGMNLYLAYFMPGKLDPTGHSIIDGILDVLTDAIDEIEDWATSGPYPGPPPIGNISCNSYKTFFGELMRTPHERQAWDHFVNGDGSPRNLGPEAMGAIENNKQVIEAILAMHKECVEKGTVTNPPPFFVEDTGHPIQRSVGGVDSVTITGTCTKADGKCCFKYNLLAKDRFDWDLKWVWKRGPKAEGAVTVINLCQKACSFNSFDFSGSSSGQFGNGCEPQSFPVPSHSDQFLP